MKEKICVLLNQIETALNDCVIDYAPEFSSEEDVESTKLRTQNGMLSYLASSLEAVDKLRKLLQDELLE